MVNQEKAEVVVKFLTQEEGGRSNDNPACLSDGRYRPLLEVTIGKSETLIGVLFEHGPQHATPNKDWTSQIVVLSQTRGLLPPNTYFKIREGHKIVGEGHVTSFLA